MGVLRGEILRRVLVRPGTVVVLEMQWSEKKKGIGYTPQGELEVLKPPLLAPATHNCLQNASQRLFFQHPLDFRSMVSVSTPCSPISWSPSQEPHSFLSLSSPLSSSQGPVDACPTHSPTPNQNSHTSSSLQPCASGLGQAFISSHLTALHAPSVNYLPVGLLFFILKMDII